jgi:hypothetical protein
MSFSSSDRWTSTFRKSRALGLSVALRAIGWVWVVRIAEAHLKYNIIFNSVGSIAHSVGSQQQPSLHQRAPTSLLYPLARMLEAHV